jgi:hypothetical protein
VSFEECLALNESRIEQLALQQDQWATLLGYVERQDSLRSQIEALSAEIDDDRRAQPQACAETDTERADRAPPSLVGSEGKTIIGAVENVRIEDLDAVFQARIDTGATTSSIDARDVQPFERDGERWIRFRIPLPGEQEPVILERPRARRVRIVQAALEEAEKRPVVELRVRIGAATQVAEFTLSERSNLQFPVLIGRNILRDMMIVDVSLKNALPLVMDDDEQDGSGSGSP